MHQSLNTSKKTNSSDGYRVGSVSPNVKPDGGERRTREPRLMLSSTTEISKTKGRPRKEKEKKNIQATKDRIESTDGHLLSERIDKMRTA